jgi:4-aminobutyrate aminotransferase-like enzyme
MKEKRGTHPAAFIIESIMALGGYRPLPPNYLKTVY